MKHKLTDKDLVLAGKIVKYFTGFNNGVKIKSPEIVERIKKAGWKFSDSELRVLIGHIRRNDLCAPGFILSDRTGYWYSENLGELKEVWKSEYSRAINILKNFAPLRKRFKHLMNEKDTLFLKENIQD